MASSKHPILMKRPDQIQDEVDIVDVWADNLDEVMNQIRAVVEDYPYVAMVRTDRFFCAF